MGEPVLVTDIDEAEARALADELGDQAVSGNAELAESADVVVLCHKPAQLAEVAAEVRGRARVVASILAGTGTAAAQAAYPDVPVYRFIPNIPAEVRHGVLCYVPGRLAAEGPERELLGLLGRAGTIPLDDEPLIEPAMALMSCGPAFMALVAERSRRPARRTDSTPTRLCAWPSRPWPAPRPASPHGYDGEASRCASRPGRHHRARADRARARRSRRPVRDGRPGGGATR